MARAQFQVLIIPYYVSEGGAREYAVTKRADGEVFDAECRLIDAPVFWEKCAEKIREEPCYFVEDAK